MGSFGGEAGLPVGEVRSCVGGAWLRVGEGGSRVGGAGLRVGGAWLRVGVVGSCVGEAGLRVGEAGLPACEVRSCDGGVRPCDVGARFHKIGNNNSTRAPPAAPSVAAAPVQPALRSRSREARCVTAGRRLQRVAAPLSFCGAGVGLGVGLGVVIGVIGMLRPVAAEIEAQTGDLGRRLRGTPHHRMFSTGAHPVARRPDFAVALGPCQVPA